MKFKRRNHFKGTNRFIKYSDKVDAVCINPTALLTEGKVYEVEMISDDKVRCINDLATVCIFSKNRFEIKD